MSTSALLLGVPWALAFSEEQQVQEMEREMRMQQSANEVRHITADDMTMNARADHGDAALDPRCRCRADGCKARAVRVLTICHLCRHSGAVLVDECALVLYSLL